MRTLKASLLGLALMTAATPAAAQSPSAVTDCGPGAQAQLRTMLFFGLSIPKGGAVSELDWQLFLRDEVTPRFPDGLTVLDARGQWRGPTGRIDHEGTKILMVLHPDTPASRRAVQEVISAYIKAFAQEAVLWETTRVCVSFGSS